MFHALLVPGMLFDSNEIEWMFYWLLDPFKKSHFQVQSVRGMTTAEESLTFASIYEIDSIDSADALDMLAFDLD